MEVFINKYNRKSYRLKNWNYSNDGWYFVTICTKNMVNHFGEVRDFIMGLSEIGCITAKYWQEIPNHFKNVRLDEWVVMPNHVHGIIIIDKQQSFFTQRRDSINAVPTDLNNKQNGFTSFNNPMKSTSLGHITKWFKGRTAFEIHKIHPNFEWQSRFYDHIITGDKELLEIREYINYNPQMWDRDRNNKLTK